MAEIELNSQTPFVLTVEGTINSAGEVIADLSAAAPGAALLAANNLSDVDSAATSRTNLGGTATGVAVFTAASAAAARTALGSTVVGDAVFIASSTGDAQTAIGATATGSSLITAANAAAAATAVGATVVGAAVLTAASEAAARTAIGSTVVGDAVFVAASTAAAQTAIGATATGSSLLTAANVAAAQTTMGLAPSDFGVMDFNCDADTTLGAIKFQATGSGTVNTVRGTLHGTGPSDAAITIDMTIGGVAVTGGGVTFGLGSNDGAVQSSNATAANTFVAGDVIAVGVTTTNTAALRGTFQIVYTRT